MGRISDRHLGLICSAIVAMVTICVFRDVLRLPYLADDWAILHKMAFRTPQQILTLAFDPSLLQIRPLQYFYTWGILALFGTYSSAFHVPALIAHICCSLVVVYVMRLLLGSTAVAWIVGFLYAMAAGIHLTPQMWMVGSSDILGPLFIFASFALLIRGRFALSAVAFLASLTFKEFALPMLGVMVLYVVQGSWPTRRASLAIQQVARKLWVHVLVALPFLAYKMVFLPSPLGFPADHPYKLSLTGGHILRNGVFYSVWFVQTITPFLISRPKRLVQSIASGYLPDVLLVGAFTALAAAVVALLLIRRRNRKHALPPRKHPPYALLGVWAVLGMAPVYFLPNHVFSYYMAYSLPALLAIAVLLAREVAQRMGVRRQEMIGVAIAALALQSVWSSMYVARWLREGDYMLKGAMRVAAVHSHLMRNHRTVPKGTAFVLDGEMIMWALRDDKALQLWYHDRSVRVYDKRFVINRGDRAYALRPPDGTEFPGTPIRGDREALDPASLICLEVRGTSRVLESGEARRAGKAR